MTNNNLFGSQFSTSNPFNSGVNPTLDASLAESYARLEALKQQYAAAQNQQNNLQKAQPATVFTDINNELKGLSEDETAFILSSKEYQEANQKYQSEFSQFLINKFSTEYLQTGNTRTLEEMLLSIRRAKEKYKDKFAADINDIRDQNKDLLEKNNKLAESNEELQKQLEEIKSRLWKEGE